MVSLFPKGVPRQRRQKDRLKALIKAGILEEKLGEGNEPECIFADPAAVSADGFRLKNEAKFMESKAWQKLAKYFGPFEPILSKRLQKLAQEQGNAVGEGAQGSITKESRKGLYCTRQPIARIYVHVLSLIMID